MESEKVKEIKKALECCSTLMNIHKTSEEQDKACQECPYRINDRCSWKLDSDALTLINELESENAELTKAVVDNLDAYRDGFNEGANLNGRVENKWKEENQKLKDRIAELEKENKEQLKQFTEKLKEKKVLIHIGLEQKEVWVIKLTEEEIDKTLKEFINE